MKTKGSEFFLHVPAILMVMSQGFPVLADNLTLKSGVRYDNVRTTKGKDCHFVYFQNGLIKKVQNREIRILRIRPTTWKLNQKDLKNGSKNGHFAPAETDEFFPLYLYSILIPGWGQYKKEEQGRAIFFFSTGLIATANYWRLRQQHRQENRMLEDPLPSVLIASAYPGTQGMIASYYYNVLKRNSVRKIEKAGNNALAILGLIWTWNVIDIFYLTRIKGTNINMAIGQKQITVGIVLRY